MKFKLEVPINKPHSEVWKAFDNPENMKVWQPHRSPGLKPSAESKATWRCIKIDLFGKITRVFADRKGHRARRTKSS